MNKTWIENKIKETIQQANEYLKGYANWAQNCKYLSNKQKEEILNSIKKADTKPCIIKQVFNKIYLQLIEEIDDIKDIISLNNEIKDEFHIDNIECMISTPHIYMRADDLVDTEEIEFNGTIIITDPCYIMRHDKIMDYSTRPNPEDYLKYNTANKYPNYEEYEKDCNLFLTAARKWEEENQTDWQLCNYGYNLEKLGFTNFITRNTLYGDWGCTTYNQHNKSIGTFCADAGLVSVLLLDEVLKYNPDYDDHINNQHCVTVIKDFKGTVQVIVKEDKEYNEYNLFIIGKGTSEGKDIKFKTSQSSL